MARLLGIGDIHGDIERMKELLKEHSVIDEDAHWCSGEDTLVYIGDLVDRGEFSFETVQFVMGLEQEALAAGGKVVSLCGNHEPLFLSKVNEILGDSPSYDCTYLFNANGGRLRAAVAASESPEMQAWIRERPFMYREKGVLFQHADSTMYYSDLCPEGSIDDINACAAEFFKSVKDTWRIFYNMTDHRFWDRNWDDYAEDRINRYMEHHGVHTIVHGHTQHNKKEPQAYFDGKIINIDGGLSSAYNKNADRGFVWSFDSSIPIVEECQTE